MLRKVFWKCQGNQIIVDPEKTNECTENRDFGAELDIDGANEINGIWGTSLESIKSETEKGMLIHMLRKFWVDKNSYIDAACELYRLAGIQKITITLKYWRKDEVANIITLQPNSYKSVEKFKEFASTQAINDFYDTIKVSCSKEKAN